MKLIVLGSPGVGKGTYAREMVKKYGFVHVSTGDLFRENIKSETELGVKAKGYIDQGQLVPDEITIGMVQERLSKEDVQKNGFLLDGFPRTIDQAESLSSFTDVEMVINYVADKEVIIGRLSGRRICKQCGAIFHTINIKPKQDGVCDYCNGELYQRDDDKPEAIEKRLVIYENDTKPLIDYYKQKDLLKEVMVNEDFSTHTELILGRIFGAIKQFQQEHNIEV
jgi:adenylate kinase